MFFTTVSSFFSDAVDAASQLTAIILPSVSDRPDREEEFCHQVLVAVLERRNNLCSVEIRSSEEREGGYPYLYELGIEFFVPFVGGGSIKFHQREGSPTALSDWEVTVETKVPPALLKAVETAAAAGTIRRHNNANTAQWGDWTVFLE